MSIRVVLADDHKIVRDGLRSLVEKQPDMEVIGEADNGRMALELVKQLRPTVVVMDIAMPDLNGIEATRQIVAEVPGIKVVALSMHSDRQFVVRMLEAGASGYLLKNGAFKELARAIHTVVAGQTYLCPEITGVVLEELVHNLPQNGSSAHTVLTPRQREVLQLLAEGNNTKQIALRLHVSVSTVETHRRQIMDKLELFSLAELVKYAIRQGIASLDT